MEREARRRADALDRYWDAVLRGDAPARPATVDENAAAVIAHLAAEHDIASLSTAQQHARQQLVAQAKAMEHAMHRDQAADVAGMPVNIGAPRLGGKQNSLAHSPRLLWAAAQVATILLVLLTLGFGYLALRPGRTDHSQPTMIPPLVASAPPSTTTQLEPVFAATLPANQIPTAGNLDEVLWHLALAPGQNLSFSADEVDCCSGPQISHVTAGELTVQVEGPIQLFRASQIATTIASASEVPAGTEIVLHPGDTVIYDFSHPAKYVNHGSAPAHVISGGFLTGSVAWNLPLLDGDETYSAPALPVAPVTVSLVRADLPPQAKVPAPPAESRVLEVSVDGDASIAKQMDGGLRNIGPEPEIIYVLTLSPAS